MDRIDRKILTLLQQRADISLSELSERVALSQTPCWKRIQRLEADGVITRRVALVDQRRELALVMHPGDPLHRAFEPRERVRDDDDVESLHERIKTAERELLVDVVGRMARDGWTVTGRKASIP